MRWTPSFGPKSDAAKVEPAGSVLVVVVSCNEGCRPVPGTRSCPTAVRGDWVQAAAGAPRSGVGAEHLEAVEHIGTRRHVDSRVHAAVDLRVES